MMSPVATLQRRLLRQLSRLGLQVVDLPPGSEVLSRSPRRIEAARIDRGLSVVVDSEFVNRRARPPAELLARLSERLPALGFRVTPVRKQAALVTAVDKKVSVVEAGPGATLVIDRDKKVSVVEAGPGATLVIDRDKKVSVVEAGPGATLVIDRTLLCRDRHEHEKALVSHLLTSMLMDVFSRYQVNVVLDVGANKGQYGRALRRAGYRGRIVSFEPVGREFEQLQRHASRDGNWSVHQMALGSEDGQIDMHVVPGTLSSALPPSDFGAERYAKLKAADVQTVPVHRLDGILDEVLAGVPDPRPYLKLDTQGFDLEAFAGLGARAADVVGMQSEVALLQIYDGMPRLPESLAVYESAGFEVAGLYPVTRERSTGRVLEFDCLMVRASAVSTELNSAG